MSRSPAIWGGRPSPKIVTSKTKEPQGPAGLAADAAFRLLEKTGLAGRLLPTTGAAVAVGTAVSQVAGVGPVGQAPVWLTYVAHVLKYRGGPSPQQVESLLAAVTRRRERGLGPTAGQAQKLRRYSTGLRSVADLAAREGDIGGTEALLTSYGQLRSFLVRETLTATSIPGVRGKTVRDLISTACQVRLAHLEQAHDGNWFILPGGGTAKAIRAEIDSALKRHGLEDLSVILDIDELAP